MKTGSEGAVVGTKREDAVYEAVRLMYQGYRVSLSYLGGEASGVRECAAVKNELRRLIDMLGSAGRSSTILLALSRIGLDIDEELACRHLEELIGEAAVYGISVMIHAEESSRTDRVLAVYKAVAERRRDVGITIRAGLRRSENDLADIWPFSGRIRIVKDEHRTFADDAGDIAEAYLRLADHAIASGRPVSMAVHDEAILREAGRLGLLAAANAEVELMRGVRTDLLQAAKSCGGRPRIYLSYG
ncbi:proline dehydrogenase family protein [Paenibacillaceae bacterium WGS1546]|uniref:proline dehydrogenase family protein n=1 Tax=Cohnella sp. WGS1546 TaxID=3366810 RepID=UPI00372D6ED3